MEGSIELPGRVSYASQESWIFSSTLRDNVLFGLPYQKDWYDSVIEACALDKVSVAVIVVSLTFHISLSYL